MLLAVFAITREGTELRTVDLLGGYGGDQGQFSEVALLLCSRYGSSGHQGGSTVALAITCRCHTPHVGVSLPLVSKAREGVCFPVSAVSGRKSELP